MNQSVCSVEIYFSDCPCATNAFGLYLGRFMDSITNLTQDLDSLIGKLSNEISADLKEVEFRNNRIQKNEVLRKALRAAVSANKPSDAGEYGAKAKIIKDAISRVSLAKFTQLDVEKEISKANPNAEINHDRIRTMLWTMGRDKKVIRQVSKGNNTQPAEFEFVRHEPVQTTKPPAGTKLPQRRSASLDA